MSLLRSTTLRQYAFALLCTFLGAWLTDVSGSMLPLALGAAVLVMSTVPLVRAIWSRKAQRKPPL